MSVRVTYRGKPLLEKVIRGKKSLASAVNFINGAPVAGRSQQYPYGIRRERSPDGDPYMSLSTVTIKIKEYNNSPYAHSILRDRGDVNSLSLINSLEANVTYFPSKTAGVSGGVEVYFARNNDASLRLESGGTFLMETGDIKGGTKMRKAAVPARPHRGVQDMVGRQIRGLLKAWARHRR
jgi:hypothetical protein